jgi:hypothetical protein
MAGEPNLPDIDRWHSRPLDVHRWSNHPEIKDLTDQLYVECEINKLDKAGNRRPKKSAKDMLQVLLLDLYVAWLNDPSLALGFSKNHNSYAANSRMDRIFIGNNIIKVEEKLFAAGYIEEQEGFHDKTGRNQSYTTRIRHSQKLRDAFIKLTVDLYDIDHHAGKPLILLRERYQDENDNKQKRLLDYPMTPEVEAMWADLVAYNDLLRRSFIDIPSLQDPVVQRTIERGKRKDQVQIIPISHDNKHVHRVFNGTVEDNWTKGGRFYGGWWLQIPRDLRREIHINDQPTVEIDYKAFHPNLLLNDPVYDPYDLEELILPDIIKDLNDQRDVIKSLILMAINADSANIAFQAFRKDQKTDSPYKKLRDDQLRQLLDAFTDRYPELKDQLNTGKALYLMNLDSKIASLVLNHFTQLDIPVLCIHDSFIIQKDKAEELKTALETATVQVAGKRIAQDSKANDRTITTKAQGNIRGYEQGKVVSITLPITVTKTEGYQLRKNKHHRWLENNKILQNNNNYNGAQDRS